MRNEEQDRKDLKGIQNYQINGQPLTYKRVIWFLIGIVTAITGVVLLIRQDNMAYILLIYLGWMLAEIAWDNFKKQNKWSKAGGGSNSYAGSSCGSNCGGCGGSCGGGCGGGG